MELFICGVIFSMVSGGRRECGYFGLLSRAHASLLAEKCYKNTSSQFTLIFCHKKTDIEGARGR